MIENIFNKFIFQNIFSKKQFRPFLVLLSLIFLLVVFWIMSNFVNNLAKLNVDLPLVEAMYYSKLTDNKVQCLLCPRKCIIKNKKRGFCNVRVNRNGKLYSLVYGKALLNTTYAKTFKSLIYVSMPYDMLRIGTAGCNMKCKFCLTWLLSQAKPEEIEEAYSIHNLGKTVKYRIDSNMDAVTTASQVLISRAPEDIINYAKKNDYKIICYTSNEPTVYYEYMLSIAKLAKREGLKNLITINGYINKQPLKDLLKYIDGVSLGLKGFTEEFYHKYCSAEFKPVLETLKILKEEKIPFEITYVIIPTLNDDLGQIRKMCLWIKDNLGEDTQLHFYRFQPSYHLAHLPPTPVSTLEKARDIANEVGLKRVYIFYYMGGGYVIPNLEEKINCPNCHRLILYRKENKLLINNTIKGKCKFCGEKTNQIILDKN